MNDEKYLKKVFTIKQNIWLIISGVVLLLFLIVLVIGNSLANSQSAQTAAKRWGRDEDYSQVSVFFSELEGAGEEIVKQLDYLIDTKLDDDSIMTKSLSARRRVSSYATVGKVTASTKNVSKEYKAIGCGGDFFVFHPLEIIYGSYFDGDDLMQDHVILDRDAAWDLFGSSDVVGQIVEINGIRHVVSGVVERDEGRLNKLSGNNESTIYISYESMAKNFEKTTVNCYEVLIPNPVKDYGLEVVKNAVSIDESRFEIVENSSRFKWTRIIKLVGAFGSRSMNSKTILYPYWENMARGLEDILTPICALGVVLISFVLINICILLIRMWTNRTVHFKDVKNFAEKGIEKYRANVKKKKETGDFI
ncbi:MAG: ABC transporter permease [Lachnospiraceae bacterium]|nr:ABC transporter permease [Lachnospiraceae bacterium]